MGKKIAIVIGAGVLVVVAGLAWVWFSAGTGEPSAEVTAPTIGATAATQPAESDAGGGQVTYNIDKAQSSAQFELDEVLDGNPKHVVGITSEIAGQILIDFDDPMNSQLGTVVINVRTLTTDSEFRNRAIRGPILGSSSAENEFAEFAPTLLEGLPDSLAVGDTAQISVTGDLLLSGVTSSVTFNLEVSVISESEITVVGSANVLRSDFGLSIPSVSSVASVTNEVLLVLDLVATTG